MSFSEHIFPPDVVIASHIWKNCMHGVGMSKFGLTVQDSTSPRNGLLMLKVIEERFDIEDVCFLYDPFKKKFDSESSQSRYHGYCGCPVCEDIPYVGWCALETSV